MARAPGTTPARGSSTRTRRAGARSSAALSPALPRRPASRTGLVYGDHCTGEIRSVDPRDPTDDAAAGVSAPSYAISSFGEDGCGHLFVMLEARTGPTNVWRIDDGPYEPCPEPPPPPPPAARGDAEPEPPAPSIKDAPAPALLTPPPLAPQHPPPDRAGPTVTLSPCEAPPPGHRYGRRRRRREDVGRRSPPGKLPLARRHDDRLRPPALARGEARRPDAMEPQAQDAHDARPSLRRPPARRRHAGQRLQIETVSPPSTRSATPVM